MPEFPETRESLIARVRDPSNRAASDQFEQLYRPVIFRIARAKGLRHSDALDLVQQVLMSVSSAIGRYEKHPDGMRFRNWLSRVTRNAILKALSRGPRDGWNRYPECPSRSSRGRFNRRVVAIKSCRLIWPAAVRLARDSSEKPGQRPRSLMTT
jgi:DNA-directed RNA polymerase specialized sigma24 family protein